MSSKIKKLGAKNQAVLVAIGLSASFALMGVWVRTIGDDFDTFQQTYLRILIAGLLAAIIFRRKFSKHFLSSISKREWSVYGVRAIFSYVLGVAGNLLLLECVFALLLGLILYGEPITMSIAIGGLLIVVSAIAVNNLNKTDEEALAPILDEKTVKANEL